MAGKRGREFWSDFLAAHARSGKSLSDYCKEQNVSYKTARNWSSKLSGDSEQGQGQNKPGQGQRGQGQGKAKKAAKPRESGKSESRQPSGKQGATPPPGELGPRKPNPGWANIIPAEPGNQRALKHGGYARYFPPELTDASVSTLPAAERLDNLIELTDLRLRSALKHRAAWDAKAEYGELTGDDYQLEEIVEKKTPEGREQATKRARPPFDEIIDHLTGRMGWLIGEKHRIERQLDVTAADAAAQRAEIMERADAEGWTASDTGKQIEKLGLEVPFTVQQLIRSELALAEPEEPEGGMTDDELEALSAEYEQQTQGEPEWLKERREEVQEIHKAKDAERKGE